MQRPVFQTSWYFCPKVGAKQLLFICARVFGVSRLLKTLGTEDCCLVGDFDKDMTETSESESFSQLSDWRPCVVFVSDFFLDFFHALMSCLKCLEIQKPHMWVVEQLVLDETFHKVADQMQSEYLQKGEQVIVKFVA